MKTKIALGFCLFLLSVCLMSGKIMAQTFIFHAEYLNNWAGPGLPFQNDINGYPSVTVQATGAAEEFIIESDNYYNKWDNYSLCSLDVATPFVFYPNTPSFDPGNSFLADSAIAGHYYTTRLKNAGYQSTQAIVMHTSAEPVLFTASNALVQFPLAGNVAAGQPVQVTVSLNGVRSPEEKVYVRYTTDNFNTSFLAEAVFTSPTDTTGDAIIPGFAPATQVIYYGLTSTLDSVDMNGDIDLKTLRQATNGGQNYTYSVLPAPVATALVVFRVNMSQETLQPGGVFLTGNFNLWGNSNPMTDIGNGIWVDTVALDTTAVVQYKFVNGNGTTSQFEIVDPLCGVDDGTGIYNRELWVPNGFTELPVVCFGECSDCYSPFPVQVQFTVNMTGQIINPLGVHLAGSFNGWNSSSTPMVAVGGGIYTVILTLDSGSVIQYKFINGNTFTDKETVPSSCGVADGFGDFNRIYTIGGSGTILPTVCFGACSDCLLPVLVPVVFRVNMSLQGVSTDGVHLAGSFNNWSTTANPMTHVGNGVYTDTVMLDTSFTVQYKFVNGNTFAGEETVPASCGVPNGVNGYDRQLTIPDTAQTLPIVCFNECTDCVLPFTVNVAFRVNLSQQIVSPQGVHLEGSFNGFSTTATPMVHIGSGVYEAVVALDTNTTYIYKFNNGDNYTTEEVVPGSCGVPSTFGGFDRQTSTGTTDSILPTVCFGQCQDCPVPVYVPVTFRVNMNQQGVSPDGVYLAGTFNGWSLNANPMTNTGGNIYETIVQLDTTQIVQYKFVNGDTVTGYEVVPAQCGFIGGGGIINRQVAVPSDTLELPVVCFGQCNDCIIPVFSQVVFTVNMSQQTVAPQGVYLAGTFNGFSITANPMTDIGSGIYTDTLLLDTTQVVQYKYVNGNVFENVPTTCGQIGGGGFINRQLSVPQADSTLTTICFGACSDCIVTGVPEAFNEVLTVYPNPANDEVTLSNNTNTLNTFTITDVHGAVLFRLHILPGENSIIDISKLSTGLYFVQTTHAEIRKSCKLFIVH